MTISQYGTYDYISRIYELGLMLLCKTRHFFFYIKWSNFWNAGKTRCAKWRRNIRDVYVYFIKKCKPKESIYLQEYLDSLLVAHKMSLYLHKIRIWYYERHIITLSCHICGANIRVRLRKVRRYSRWCMIKRINANKTRKNIEGDVNSGSQSDGFNTSCGVLFNKKLQPVYRGGCTTLK